MTKLTAENMISAGEFLEREAKRAEQLIMTASVLKEAGTLQARAAELDKRIVEGQKKAQELEAAVQASRYTIAEAQAGAARILKAADEEAIKTETVAMSRAKVVLDNANAKANAIVAEADSYAVKTRQQAESAYKSADTAAAAAKAEVAAAQQKVTAKQAELKALEDRLAKARAEAEKILRG